MKFILLFGPQAVGKMTVGQELERLTGLKLFHNHMTIDLVHPYFGFSSETWRLADLFRKEIFTSVAKSNSAGMIFTYVWAFDLQKDWDFVRQTRAIFENEGGEVYLVELEADVDERIRRNVTPNRLEHKPTKRNIEESHQHLIDTLDTNRLNSAPGEIQEERYFRINNTQLSPEETAFKIKQYFQL